MISNPEQCYVWVWLPGHVDPVVAGVLARDDKRFVFRYGRSYLNRKTAIALNKHELPLGTEIINPIEPMMLPSSIRDGSPDAWGRRVIMNRIFGKEGVNGHYADLDEMTYLLESGSDRIGAYDFQQSPNEYVPRISRTATLDELLEAASLVEKGVPLSPELDQALNHGTSIGGARPKALIESAGAKFVAKFSSTGDQMNVVKGEFVTMRLASLCGMDVAPVRLAHAKGKDILLIERFDRELSRSGWTRKIMASALTLFGLDEMLARYCSYEQLTDIIRADFHDPRRDLRELFSRLVFNILCSNTDDHGRNHAAFFDGKAYRLTPAYDICPQVRTGTEASQAMLILGNNNQSRLAVCLAAREKFLLSEADAIEIIEHQIETIGQSWDTVVDEAQLSEVDATIMRSTQMLHQYAFSELPEAASHLERLGRKTRAAL
ncbi:type II toxin-antitoxin system HipA family toxin [Pseudomonas putida]|uniref:Type II toxin-antitoxin system HipA family toxin n=1 Tax=Pseudomonas putida TaxID=303 RepID=A0A8I1JKV5_PSEPU|nr:type II toxin-antitoxin system HipA family toxin [Pseudomonas putida]MBI6885129.1 type II toxin-antitoxin system HipA family toxin [Pseudomonas putida]